MELNHIYTETCNEPLVTPVTRPLLRP